MIYDTRPNKLYLIVYLVNKKLWTHGYKIFNKQ